MVTAKDPNEDGDEAGDDDGDRDVITVAMIVSISNQFTLSAKSIRSPLARTDWGHSGQAGQELILRSPPTLESLSVVSPYYGCQTLFLSPVGSVVILARK